MSDGAPGSSHYNPIWHRGWRIYVSSVGWPAPYYAYVHDDFDGAPDGNDHRCGGADTIEQCKAEIDDFEEMQMGEA